MVDAERALAACPRLGPGGTFEPAASGRAGFLVLGPALSRHPAIRRAVRIGPRILLGLGFSRRVPCGQLSQVLIRFCLTLRRYRLAFY